jgi:hypothetical protein
MRTTDARRHPRKSRGVTAMFIVLAWTAEYAAAAAAANAADEAAHAAAFEAKEATQQYYCCGTYETEATARASLNYNPKHGEVAYLFIREGDRDGRFACFCGDNGWEFANSSPSIAVGLFATRDEAVDWAENGNGGSVANQVFELDITHVEQLAAA